MNRPDSELRRSRPEVSVVIPALNEAKNLEHVLAALPESIFEVVLVDGGSTDGTPEAARRLRSDVRVIPQTRRGKGNALACGFAACSGDVIVMLDADGSADPAEIPRFVDALAAGADFAKGSRFTRGGGSADITRFRRAGNRFLMRLVNALCRTGYSDLCYGYNAFWASTCLPVLGLDWQSPAPAGGDGRLWGDGFEIETLINIRVAAAGLTVVEVPSYEHRRLHGASNLSAVRDGLRVLRTIVSETEKRRRVLSAWQRRHRTGRAELAPMRLPSVASTPALEAHIVDRRITERRRENRFMTHERRTGVDRRRQPIAMAI
jgi:glycosyltransferase involved in cell wall biosynthesis